MRPSVNIFLLVLLCACGLETEPNPNYQAGSGGSNAAGRDGGPDGSSGTGGSGGAGGESGGVGGDAGGGAGGMTGGAGGESGGAGGETLQSLDAVGNTTKAITKGVAIGSAVIAAVSLFGAFLTDTRVIQLGLNIPLERTLFGTGINIAGPIVFVGFLIGGGLIFMFSSLLIRGVNRAAFQMIGVVRRQLRMPGIMEGTKTPDYAEAVSVSTKAAQRELLPLGVIAVLTPIVVGFQLGAAALGGFLAGIILAGQLMAVFMSNAGGAWDNAKKYIEDGHYGGKRSEPHKAAVVGDTVGDPFKDTAGPALNPMIKVVNLVSLLAAPLVVTVAAQNRGSVNVSVLVVMIALLGVIMWAILRSKRTDPATEQMVEAVGATSAGD